MVLSHAQATEVAKRFNPTSGQTLWFDDNGSLLTRTDARRAVAAQSGEVYVCRRSASADTVEVARVDTAGLEAGAEPAFGEPW